MGIRSVFLRCAAALVLLMSLGLGKAWGQDSITCVFRCTGIGTSQTYYLAHTSEDSLSSEINRLRALRAETEFNPNTSMWHYKPSTSIYTATKFFPLTKQFPPGNENSNTNISKTLANSASTGNAFRGAIFQLSYPLYYGSGEAYVSYNPETKIWTLNHNTAQANWTYGYEVTKASTPFHGIASTLSGDEIISSLGSYGYSYAYVIKDTTYIDYKLANTSLYVEEHHYWYDNADHAAVPTNWNDNVTATWSLSDNAASYAMVDATTGELTVTKMPVEDLVITLTCTFTDGSNIHRVRKEITLKGMYLLMDSDGRIVKRDGTNSGLLNTTSFTPEGTLWTVTPFEASQNDVRQCYKAKILSSSYYLSTYHQNSNPVYVFLKSIENPSWNEGCTGLPNGEIKIKNTQYIYWDDGASQWKCRTDLTDSRVKPYGVSYSEGNFIGLSATLNGNTEVTSLGNYSYSYSAEISEQVYTLYEYDGTSHYWYDNADHAAVPTDWNNNVTATWSLSDNAASYATVDAATGELTVIKIPAGDLTITLTCTFTDGTRTLSLSKNITLLGRLYLLMDGDGRIVKREGISTTMLSSSSFTPEGTLWIAKPVAGAVNKHNFEAKSDNPNCYLSVAGWVSVVIGSDTVSVATIPYLKQIDPPGYNEQCSGLSEGEIRISNAYTTYWDAGEERWKVEKNPNPLPEKRVKPYGVSYSEGNFLAFSAMLSGNAVVTETGSYPITLSTETFNETYGLYQYNNASHYWYDRADHDAAPVNWGNIVSTIWTIEDNAYATISSTGVLTVTSMPATNTELVITCTITDDAAPSHTVTLTHNVLLTNAATLSNVLTIDDRENHNWSYYAGTDIEGYNDRYRGTLYSPQPRDVKITYLGNGGAVSSVNVYPNNELEENFVYYKTLEQGSVEGEYPYGLIPNPFSKRPKVGGKVQGFVGWRIVSGGHYIKGYSNDDVLPLELGHKVANSLVLENLPDGTDENTMAQIIFEAIWTDATVVYLESNDADFTFNASAGGNPNGTYETNLLVIRRDNFNYDITAELPVTVMQVEPDGSADYRIEFGQTGGTAAENYNFTGRLIPANDQMTKMEFVKWAPNKNNNNDNIDLGGKSFHLGRGVIRALNRNIRGATSFDPNIPLDQTIRIESGKFIYFYPFTDVTEGIPINRLDIVLGCDYDRAKNNHDNLEMAQSFMLCNGEHAAKEMGEDKVHIVVKSGKHQTQCPPNTGEFSGNSFYISNPGSTTGTRDLLVEGGIMRHIAGGASYNSTMMDKVFTRIRIKGGKFLGCVFGGAARVTNYGCTKLVITGGQFNSWVAGAANGTLSTTDEGVTHGRSYLYVGGNAHVGALTTEEDIRVNAAQGGNVFGAGCGNSTSETGGQIKYGSNVVIADNAYIRRGVYGGGAYAQTPSIANVYILNGTIAAEEGNVYPIENNNVQYVMVAGGVFGGAALKGGGSSNIMMVGGTVNHGIYGGSNHSGIMTGGTDVAVRGGTVQGSVFGGGLGAETVIGTIAPRSAQNTYVTLKGNALVTNSVYGGGEQGKVAGNTTVNLEGDAVVNGNAFAAGKGAETDFNAGEVLGNATLNMKENAWVKDCIFGGGEIANVGETVSYTYEEGHTIDVPKTNGSGIVDNGITTVNLSGGTVGVNRTLAQIQADHNSCHVFGAGKGSPAEAFNMWTNVNKAVVNITGSPRIYGSVFGGSDVGHVLGDIEVDVNMASDDDVIGTYGYSEIDGNIFGAGHGFVSGSGGGAGTQSVTAGGTQGNVNVRVRGKGTILGSVFGGGRIASAGIALSNESYAGDSIPDTGTQHFGHVEVTVEGDVVIGHDYVAVAEDGEEYVVGDVGGNIYGGAMGLDVAPTSVPGRMSHVKQTQVTVQGNALVKGTVNGGGESGDVWQNTEVVIDGNCTIGLPRTGDLDKLIYSGNVFGGSWGSDSREYVDMGRIYGNTTVRVNNGSIKNNVYGGGEYASVGTWTGGSPVEGTGRTQVIVNGGTIGPWDGSGHNGNVYGGGMGVEDEEPGTHNQAGVYYNDFGQVLSTDVQVNGGTVCSNVFGGGQMGSVGKAITSSVANFGHTNVSISGGTIGDAENSSPMVGNVYGGGKGDIDRDGFGLAFDTHVNVSGNARVTGSVFGGSEDGQVGYFKAATTNPASPEINIPGSTDVRILGGNVGTDGNTAAYKGYVYGGGRGYHINPSNPEEGKALGRVNGNTRVTVTGGDIWQFVFGGGNQALVTGNKRVNIVGGWVHRDVYGGSNAIPSDEGWLQLHTGLKTVNIYGGKLNNVYGCSRSTLDGALDNSTPPRPKDDVTSFVNISGGEIYGSVHGAGQSGQVYGSVMVYIGENAIYNAPYNMEGSTLKNVDRDDYNEVSGNTGRSHHPNKLLISGSVYGGADYFENQYHPGSWDDFNVTGYSNIYVDGKHYDMGALPDPLTFEAMNNKAMLINGNIYGSGFQCESGQKGRTVTIRHYGNRVNVGGSGSNKDWFKESTRFMGTIQRCDNLVIDNSNFSFTGARILGSDSPEKYSVAKIDSCMYVANASGISLGYGDGSANMDSIRMLRSVHLNSSTDSVYMKKSPGKLDWDWIGVRDTEKYANNLYYVHGDTPVSTDPIGYANENVLVFNNDSRLYVRYQKKDLENNHLVWKGNHYGELNGFFRMIAANFLPWGNESFAYARPKLTTLNGGAANGDEERNTSDGGFLSYERKYNFFIQGTTHDGNDGGTAHTQTYQYPYTNVMQLNQRGTNVDMEEFREWVIAEFKGHRWYVDGTRGWGRDLMGSGTQTTDQWTYDWGLYPDKPKASVSGDQGIFKGTNHWISTSSQEPIEFHFKDNIVYYQQGDEIPSGHQVGDINEAASTYKDVIYVVGPINGALENISLNPEADKEGATLMLYRYPGGHPLSTGDNDATNSVFHEKDGSTYPVATTYPRQTESDYHGLQSGNQGPGANYGAMVVVGKNKSLTLDNTFVDGLFGHVGIDVTYMDIPASFEQRKVMRPLVVTNTGSQLTLKDGTVLKRGGNNISDSEGNPKAPDYYYDGTFNMGIAATTLDTMPHGGALFVHPAATVNVEGFVRACNNIQQLRKAWVDTPDPGHYEYTDIESNVFLPTFDTYLHIKDALSEDARIGVTNPAGNNENRFAPIDYQYNTFSPVAVADKSGVTPDPNVAIANNAWKNDNFYDDLNWFFCSGENFANGSYNNHDTYYNSSIQDYPDGTEGHEYPMGLNPDKTLFFGWTWANVVRSKPTGYVPSTTEGKVTVTTPQGLAWLISRVNGLNGQTTAFGDTLVLQTNDIDLEQYVWVPIGTERDANKRFEGGFDGQGHLIKHMNIHYIGIGDQRYEMNNYGLFGAILGAHINRTFVVDGYIHPSNMANMGGLVGWAEGVKVGNNTILPLIENSEAAVEMQLKNPVESNAVGGLAGHFLIGNIRNSMAMPVVKGDLGYVGGLVGYAGDLGNVSTLTGDRKIENCFANITYDVRKYENNTLVPNDQIAAGGLIGHNRAFTMQNCYVAWTGADNQRGLTNSNFGTLVQSSEGTVTKCYDFVNSFTNQSSLYDECASYTAVGSSDELGYLYADNLIEGDTTLVARLTMNAWGLNPNNADTVYSHWARPTLGEINGDLPVLLLGEFDGTHDYRGSFYCVGTYAGGSALQYGGPVRDENHQISDALKREKATMDNDCLFVYGDVDETTEVAAADITQTKVSVYEHASIIDYSTLKNCANTYVGISFDNSFKKAISSPNVNYGLNGADLTFLSRDWHMFSTPLSDAPLGFNYGTDNNNDGPRNNPWVSMDDEFNWLTTAGSNECGTGADYRYWMDDTKDGYFPTSRGSLFSNLSDLFILGSNECPVEGKHRYPYGMDLYAWYEPEYHWINFKRNGPNHWHSDGSHQHLDYYGSGKNVNEETLIKGKGYLASIVMPTFMQSHGILNQGDKTIALTITSGAALPGWNLVGNPYHGYLDFNLVGKSDGPNAGVLDNLTQGTDSYGAFYVVYDADQFVNKDASTAFRYYPVSGSPGGDYADRYLHPHQGFYVRLKDNYTSTNLTFNEDMLVTREQVSDGHFRKDDPAYPLVNLYLSSENGCADITVIEFDRPEWGGATKLKELRVGNGIFYGRHGDGNYAALFVKKGTSRVPLWFEAKEDDVFTMKWERANGDFHNMYLIDNLTGVQYDMLENDSYTFLGRRDDYSSRFYIVFSFTDVEEHEEGQVESFVFYDGSEWVVTGEGDLDFIDMLGHVLVRTHMNGGQSRVTLPRVAPGVYLMRLTNGKECKVQKIIVN